MRNHEQRLIEQIERAAREYQAAAGQAVMAAVARGLGTMNVGAAKAQAAREAVAGKAKASQPVSARNATEIASMTERLHAAVRAQPGETMTTLARDMGDTPRALKVAVARLKREGRIRSIGERQFTRYFPLL